MYCIVNGGFPPTISPTISPTLFCIPYSQIKSLLKNLVPFSWKSYTNPIKILLKSRTLIFKMLTPRPPIFMTDLHIIWSYSLFPFLIRRYFDYCSNIAEIYIAKILLKYCWFIVEILFNYCWIIVELLLNYSWIFVELLLNYCWIFVEFLLKYCWFFAELLLRYCWIIVEILLNYC